MIVSDKRDTGVNVENLAPGDLADWDGKFIMGLAATSYLKDHGSSYTPVVAITTGLIHYLIRDVKVKKITNATLILENSK